MLKRFLVLFAAVLLLIAAVWGGHRLLGIASTAPEAPSPSMELADEVTGEQVASSETITILHTNDFHGAVEPEVSASTGRESGGLVNLASLIIRMRAEDPEHTLVLDAGDAFQGSYVSNSTYGEVVMAVMNAVPYDAWTLGNHEFDWGQEPLRARISQAHFPTLAANLLDRATGRPWDAVQPYVIRQIGRARVAILGLTYQDTPEITRAGVTEGLEFRGAVETVKEYLPELERQADLIVVLSHLGYDEDRLLARTVDGLDVIVGGHTHVFLERPDQVNGTLIVQAGAKGQVLGRLTLTVDLETRTISEVAEDTDLVAVEEAGTPNAEVAAIVDSAMAEAAETIHQPIGEAARTLEPKRAGEFALGNLIADAMLAAQLSDGQQADIALHNIGGIRAALEKGPITFGELYAVLPFDNQLMALSLSGTQILEILEHSVSDRAGALEVAGMTYRFAMSRPRGQRVTEVSVGGQPLEPTRVYRVATIDYLAGGGDGYDTFLEGTDPTYGDTAVWAVAEYIKAHSPVDPQVEGRIRGQ